MKELSREMLYLYIGNDINRMENSTLTVKYFKGIQYFEVDGIQLITDETRIYCACNESYCWHVFKVLVTEGKKFTKMILN
ncbi:hypothetical protein PAEPH01_0515 [Pancytospora epiphaga]|nr:hypothetical protein PAEPH01_0515 [Pancytospora epiphaga]